MKSSNGLRVWLFSSVLAIAACSGSSGANKDGGTAGSSGGSGPGAAGASGGDTSGTGGAGAVGGSVGGGSGATGAAGAGGTGGSATGAGGTGGKGGSGTAGATGGAGTAGAGGKGGSGTAGAAGGAGAGGKGGAAGVAGTGGQAGAGGAAGAGTGAGGTGGTNACLSSLKVTQVAVNSLDNPMTQPLFVTGAPGTTDLFVAGQGGKVYILKNGVGPAKVFLDISALVKTNNEDGLLGMTFHPGYATNGRFFVYIVTKTTPLTTAVVEFGRSAANPDLADPTEKRRQVVARKDAPDGSSGNLAFGPDGYLYVGVGVEPTLLTMTGADLVGPGGFAVHGAIIRLDVSSGIVYAPGGGTYVSPLWANGLREPWRFSFDRGTNDMYIGDVGDSRREEVDYEAYVGRVGGRHYGYLTFEGNCCSEVADCSYNSKCTSAAPGYTFPIYDYPHANGDGAVIGGYVYRGKNIPCLNGTYLFGDYLTTVVRALVVKNGAVSGTVQQVPGVSYVGGAASVQGLTSFGEDNNGEVYLVFSPQSGTAAIYRIDPK